MQHPRQGRQEGQILCITARPIGQNEGQRPVPNPKGQGCDPLFHWGKPQHETAELGGNKQTRPGSRASRSIFSYLQSDLHLAENLPITLRGRREPPGQKQHLPHPPVEDLTHMQNDTQEAGEKCILTGSGYGAGAGCTKVYGEEDQ
ncbi:hypothetical protein ATANTOWER_029092, partial [Ataeniobius toweri]|nr:hypothetical protein [Ataeniobius toweri]